MRILKVLFFLAVLPASAALASGICGTGTLSTTYNPFTNKLDFVCVGGGGSPGGSNQQIQFNQSSSFGGDQYLIWDYTNHLMAIGVNSDGIGFNSTVDIGNSGSFANRALTLHGGNGAATSGAGAVLRLDGNNGTTNQSVGMDFSYGGTHYGDFDLLSDRTMRWYLSDGTNIKERMRLDAPGHLFSLQNQMGAQFNYGTNTSTLTITTLNCTGNLNGGKLTTNSSGDVACGDDISGGGGVSVYPATSPVTLNGGGVSLSTLSITIDGTSVAVFNSTGCHIRGVQDDSLANSFDVGYATRCVSPETQFTANNAYKDFCNITISSGDWEIIGLFYFENGGGVNAKVGGGISIYPGDDGTTLTGGDNYLEGPPPTSIYQNSFTLPYHVHLNGSTTYYEKGLTSYSGTAMYFRGSIEATRIR